MKTEFMSGQGLRHFKCSHVSVSFLAHLLIILDNYLSVYGKGWKIEDIIQIVDEGQNVDVSFKK